MRVLVKHLWETSRSRPAGYMVDCLLAGKPDGDALVISDDRYAELVKKYRPSLAAQAVTVIAAGARWLASGLKLAPLDLWFQRSCVCALCPVWDARGGRCTVCTCFELKLHLPSEACPVGKW